MSEHSSGCICVDLRYKVMGNPEISAVCHCRYCKLQTGSAFGTLAYFKDENVKITAGKGKKSSFMSESGTPWETVICDTCATTVSIKLEVRAGLTGVIAGTLDPSIFWFQLDREAFTRSKAHFVGDIIAKNTHETSAYYDPKIEEPKRGKGGKMTHTGECYCGDIWFEFEDPIQSQLLCHCRECRYLSGGEANASIVILEETFRVMRVN